MMLLGGRWTQRRGMHAAGSLPSKTKPGNNGAVSCDSYCKNSWGGYRCASCSSAIDSATNQSIGCGTVRGVGSKQVSCCCGGCGAPLPSYTCEQRQAAWGGSAGSAAAAGCVAWSLLDACIAATPTPLHHFPASLAHYISVTWAQVLPPIGPRVATMVHSAAMRTARAPRAGTSAGPAHRPWTPPVARL